jgi:hypothetical protein
MLGVLVKGLRVLMIQMEFEFAGFCIFGIRAAD